MEATTGFFEEPVTLVTTAAVQYTQSAQGFSLPDYFGMAIALIGFISNGLVLVVIQRSQTLRQHLASLFIISQSLLDMLSGLFLLLQIIFSGHRELTGVIGNLECHFWQSHIWFWSLFLSSTWNLVALTLERYLEVTMPMKHKTMVTEKKIQATIIAIWLLGFLYSLVINLSTGRVVDGKCHYLAFWVSEAARLFFGVVNTGLRYVVPCLIFIVCYTHMAWFLHKRRFIIGVMMARDSVREANMERARNNVLKTLIYVAVAYILCCSWNQMLFILFSSGAVDASIFSTPFFNFSLIAFYSNSMVNPFIYTFKYKQFQKSAAKTFCKRCVKAPAEDSQVHDLVARTHASYVGSSSVNKAQRLEPSASHTGHKGMKVLSLSQDTADRSTSVC